MKIKVFNKKQEASDFLAHLFLSEVKKNPKIRIGLATGKTFSDVYKRIVYLTKREKINLSNIKIRIIKLFNITRKDNFRNLNDSPKFAITIGIKEILDSKKIVLAVFGKN